MKKRKKNKKIKTVNLIYNPSEKGNFRLSQALRMLLGEEDIRNYLLKEKSNIKKYGDENL
ncbi:MAG: hypothetical protein COV00_03485 [Candidatus Tagabacteria bacterium CG10_big_fil_rev_8_21_14_0_10_40_13]|uniref:Uncharacterized protein n=1 Tax=Candidatus Tagabacteria bacterium CG10_big_fil_rev_8_21_14_0_10_40_13 TaxID=1975022 RepID=A0A2M8L819_9BACT|nr:MAG: hypothetical protein COV00_03485 [Candidatus Tagabacteria bacterium CG10_big_fil_rev_8_21_14_0_10_40_13]